MRILVRLLVALLVLGLLALASFRLSPWPSVLIVRHLFDGEAAKAMIALQPLVPPGLQERLDIPYRDGDSDARLDLILPPGPAPDAGWPVVVWVHGGAWVSGSKENVGNYLRLLTSDRFAMVNVDYTLAPSAQHPEPTRQVNAALGWLMANGAAAGLDTSRVILAGDSAGAQIAMQTAIAQTDPAYAAALGLTPMLPASQLRGLLLFCGAYDARQLNLDGAFGGFLRNVLWAYFGQREFASAPGFDLFSVAAHLPATLPPLFISAGNADPLGPQSTGLADRADALGIETDTLFFPADFAPPLGHEYQFDLSTEAGKLALERARAFLAARLSPTAP